MGCDSGNFSVQEDFLCFVSTADTTVKTLTKSLLEKLEITIVQYGGTGYDGAGNVSGKLRGILVHIKQLYPAATYVNCRNHSLNLSKVHSTCIPLVRNTLNAVHDIMSFITASPKRLQTFLDESSTKQHFKKFSGAGLSTMWALALSSKTMSTSM